jgi:hypothetical protein
MMTRVGCGWATSISETYMISLQCTYTVDIDLESPLGRAAVLGEEYEF